MIPAPPIRARRGRGAGASATRASGDKACRRSSVTRQVSATSIRSPTSCCSGDSSTRSLVSIAHDLIVWTRRLALIEEFARHEPDGVRHRLLHVAGRLTFTPAPRSCASTRWPLPRYAHRRVQARHPRRAAWPPGLVLVPHWPVICEPTLVLRYPEFTVMCGIELTADWNRPRPHAVRGSMVTGTSCVVWVRGRVRFYHVSLGYPRVWRARARGPVVSRRILPESG